MSSREEDEAWRAIVENFGERATLDDDASASGADRDADEAASSPAPGADESGVDRPAVAGPAPSDEPFDSEDEGFVPPDPPVHVPDPPRLLAWIGLFGSPAAILGFVLAGATVPQWLGMLLLAAFIGGFGYLVWTMPQEPRNPWDDGSRL